MKSLLFSFLLLSVSISFSQSNDKLISFKELTKNITILDTVTYTSYFHNKEIKSIRIVEKQKIIVRGKEEFVEHYLKQKYYRKNGNIKEVHFYNNWLFLNSTYYDLNGLKKYEYIYNNEDTEAMTIWMGNKYYQGGPSSTYQRKTFKKGNLILNAYFLEKKKDGIWEYYNRNNELIKKVIWKKGEKIMTEKF